MKIAILTFDLGRNCLGRTYLLAKVLQRRYEVEMYGFVYPHSNYKIWKPCDTGEFNYHTVRTKSFLTFLKAMHEMINNINADVIYAAKPRLPSFGTALWKKKISGIPVVLDIDDYEMAWFENLSAMDWLRSVNNPSGPIYTRRLEKYIGMADAVTTVSNHLQKTYGRGIIVPHGKDTDHFDPSVHDRDTMRRQLNLETQKVIMFLGSPRPHKGLDDIIKALNLIERNDIKFVIIGAGTDREYENQLKSLGGDKLLLKGEIPFYDIPRYLSAADLVVLPQKASLASKGQIPAKIFDAMAMAKPIIATNVADLSKILDGCGIIVEPGDLSMLAARIDWILSHETEAETMGKRAREKCIAEYSWDAMEETLVDIFENLH